MDAKNKWIEEVENSLSGLAPAQGNPFLYTRIMSRLASAQVAKAPAKLVWLTSCALLVLLVLNILALSSWQPSKAGPRNDAQALASQFRLMNTNTINYNQP